MSKSTEKIVAELRAAIAMPVDPANLSGVANIPRGGVNAEPATPDAVDVCIAEDGQSVIIMDPADDPVWSLGFQLPVWAAYDGDKAVLRITPDGRNLLIASDRDARPVMFPIPKDVRRGLARWCDV